MMRRIPLLTAAMLSVALLAAGIHPAWGQDKQPARRPSSDISFSYSPLYQFDTDLEGGGSFDVARHFLRFDAMRSFGSNLRMGLGLSYQFEKWHFDNRFNVNGATPWSKIHRPGINLPVSYRFENRSTLGFTPAFELSGEAGAKTSESFTYGATFSLAHPFSRDLYLGVGFGLFDRLEKTVFFPFIIVNWKISEQLRLSNPFRAGPAGPAGLELVYSPLQRWEFGIGGAFRGYRFRLDDTSAVPNGVGENDTLVTFVRAQRKLGSALTLDLAVGALFDGELSIEDSNGNGLGKTTYDTAPIIALTFDGKF